MDNTCVSFINVGKGDCILLQVGESAALIDTGYDRTWEEVVSHLRKMGVNRLEFVIITHYDRDHIGGVCKIGKAFAIDTIYLPAYEGADRNYQKLMSSISELNLVTRRVTDVVSLELAGATLSVYPSGVAYDPHAKGDEGNDNDLSLVTSLCCGGDTFLFTGDLEKEGHESYLKSKRGQFDVLKFPCHGEKCPYTEDLLRDANPKIAVITDSESDPADKKPLKLLSEYGIKTYRTSVDGTVVVTGDGAGNYSVSSHGKHGSLR